MAKRLFVGNLPYAVDGAKLQEIFGAVGTVVSADVISNKYTGRSKGFGFVEMSTDEEADKAIAQLNGKDVDGRAIVVNEAKPRETSIGGPGQDDAGGAQEEAAPQEAEEQPEAQPDTQETDDSKES